MPDKDSGELADQLRKRLLKLGIPESEIAAVDAARREAAADVFGVAQKKTPPAASAADGHYSELRDRLVRLKRVEEIDAFRAELERTWKDDAGERGEAAARLLVEIEHGRIMGAPAAVHERKHSPAEREFFNKHPLLDRDNFKLLDDGRVIVYLDKLQIMDSFSAAIRRLVVDALPPKTLDGAADGRLDPSDAVLVVSLTKKIGDLLTNAHETQAVREFRRVARLETVSGELIVSDIARFGGVVGALRKLGLELQGRPEVLSEIDNVPRAEWRDLAGGLSVPDFHREPEVQKAERGLFTVWIKERLGYLGGRITSILPYSEHRGNVIIGDHVYGIDRNNVISRDGSPLAEALSFNAKDFKRKLGELIERA